MNIMYVEDWNLYKFNQKNKKRKNKHKKAKIQQTKKDFIKNELIITRRIQQQELTYPFIHGRQRDRPSCSLIKIKIPTQARMTNFPRKYEYIHNRNTAHDSAV